MPEAVTHESAPPPDIDHVLRVRLEQELARQAEVPDLDKVEAERAEQADARVAELPDLKQVAKDHAEQAAARVAPPPDLKQVERDHAKQELAKASPETLARLQHEQELREHAEHVAAQQARERAELLRVTREAAMKARTEGSE